jgi:peptide/nickel transport system substrate-binding protein
MKSTVDRVRTTVAAMAAAAMTVGLAACGAADGGTGGGGPLTFAVAQQPDCLDPQASPAGVTAMIDRNIFDSLVDMTQDGQFKPWLASSWTVTPDGLTYTFELRLDVKFHDGTSLTAAAVKATLDHAVDPKTKSYFAKDLISGYASADAVNDHEVVVHLSHPNSAFLQALSTSNLGIQSLKALTGDQSKLCAQPVGSGPFSFVSWTRDQRISLRRFDAYHWAPPSAARPGPAAAPGLDIQFMTEAKVRYGALTSGQVDVAQDLAPADGKALQADGSFEYYHTMQPGLVESALLNAARGPLADVKVRTALLRSVDLDQLVRTATFGQYDRAWSALSPATVYYDPLLIKSWPYDPVLAGQLLDQAGWNGRDADGYRTKDGARLTITWPYGNNNVADVVQTLAQGVQAEAKKVGIEIVRTGQDAGTWTNNLLHGNMDMFETGSTRDEPDVLRRFFETDATADKGGANLFHISFPQLDGWLTEASTVSDPQTRRDDYAKAQKFLVDNALLLPLYVSSALVGASSQVHGLRFDLSGYPVFRDATR